MDCGADTNFIRESTANNLDLQIDSYETNTVIFGNGSEASTNLIAHINPKMPLIILPDDTLIEDLISCNPIVDLGYFIVLHQFGGWVEKNGVRVFKIEREGLKWTIDINTLKCLSASLPYSQQESSHDFILDETQAQISRQDGRWILKPLKNLAASKPSLNDRVINLHRRMSHASGKTMFTAVKAGTWIGCDVTAEEVMSVMNNHTCIICQLAKKNRIAPSPSRTNPRSFVRIDITRTVNVI